MASRKAKPKLKPSSQNQSKKFSKESSGRIPLPNSQKVDVAANLATTNKDSLPETRMPSYMVSWIKKLWFNYAASPFKWMTQKIFIPMITVLGLLSSIASLSFDVSIDAFASLNSKEPLETRFVLGNQSPIAIYSVAYECIYPAMKLPGMPADYNTVGLNPVFATERIDAHGKFSIRCNSSHALVDESMLEIGVSYRPKFWPFRKNGFAKFLLKRDSGGNVVWLPAGPLSVSAIRR